jgi:hypothetical protein
LNFNGANEPLVKEKEEKKSDYRQFSFIFSSTRVGKKAQWCN